MYASIYKYMYAICACVQVCIYAHACVLEYAWRKCFDDTASAHRGGVYGV